MSKFKTVIIDADPLVYRIGFGMEEVVLGDLQSTGGGWRLAPTSTPSRIAQKMSVPRPPAELPYTLSMFIKTIKETVDADGVELWLSGATVFREAISTVMQYKGNRSKSRRPYYYNDIRQLLVNQHKATVVEYIEADDACAIRLQELGDSAVLASVDKDLDTVPGFHYNFSSDTKKGAGVYKISALEAERNFYAQLLTGDSVDHIQGLAGYGPAKGKKALKDCSTAWDMYCVVAAAYLAEFGEGYSYYPWQCKANPSAVLSKQTLREDGVGRTDRCTLTAEGRLSENARLLRLLDKWPTEGVDLWQPPRKD